jgi:circadian clock protein KaiB
MTFSFKLFIAGSNPKSSLALQNLNELCEQYLPGQYILEVIDLLLHPELAELHGILAIPTLVKTDPEPMKRLIGILSDKIKILSALNITAA